MTMSYNPTQGQATLRNQYGGVDRSRVRG